MKTNSEGRTGQDEFLEMVLLWVDSIDDTNSG